MTVGTTGRRAASGAGAAARQQNRALGWTAVVTGAFSVRAAYEASESVAGARATFDELQQVFMSRLGVLEGWSAATDHRRASYRSGGGFAQRHPVILVRYSIDLDGARDRDLAEHGHPGSVNADGPLTIDFYDFGAAVLRLPMRIAIEREDELPSALQHLKRLVHLDADHPSAIVTAIRSAIALAAEQFAAAFPDSEGTHPDGMHAGRPIDGEARILWLHPVHRLPRNATGRGIAPPYSTTLAIRGGDFMPGIGWSLIAVDPEADTLASDDTDEVQRLVELQWAVYALLLGLDHRLLQLLDEHPQHDGRLSELETRSSELAEEYRRITRVRLRMESVLNSLGGDSQAIWDAIAGVQRLATLTAGVDRKLEFLRQEAERRVAHASTRLARRSNAIMLSLSATMLVSLVAAIVTMFTDGFAQEYWIWRLAVVAVGTAAGIVIVWISIQDLRRGSRRTALHPSDGSGTRVWSRA